MVSVNLCLEVVDILGSQLVSCSIHLDQSNSRDGIKLKPDPAKVEAIMGMPTSMDKAGVRCLLGMINFLAVHNTKHVNNNYSSS